MGAFFYYYFFNFFNQLPTDITFQSIHTRKIIHPNPLLDIVIFLQFCDLLMCKEALTLWTFRYKFLHKVILFTLEKLTILSSIKRVQFIAALNSY